MKYYERVDVNGNTQVTRLDEIVAFEIHYAYPNRMVALNNRNTNVITTEDAELKALFYKMIEEDGYVKITTSQKNVMYFKSDAITGANFNKTGKEATLFSYITQGYNYVTTIASEIKALRDFIDEQNKDPEPPEPEPVTILDFFHDGEGFYKAYVAYAESHK